MPTHHLIHPPPRIVPTVCRALLVIGVCVLGSAHLGYASCDVIPSVTQSFRAAQTSIDRPFASPGDFVTMSADRCASSQALPRRQDVVVTIVFLPPHGPRNVVVLAANCADVRRRAKCRREKDVAAIRCIHASEADLQVDAASADGSQAAQVRFRFPDTTRLFGKTLTGPARIGVTSDAEPMPCELVDRKCSEASGLVACADALYANDGTCGLAPHPVFSHFTALPFPNDYQALCTGPNDACTGTAQAMQLTVDDVGNLLLPIDWTGVLVGGSEAAPSGSSLLPTLVPIARSVKATLLANAFAGSDRRLEIPSDDFLGSFSPDGRKLPPIFTPLHDPTAVGEVKLFGSADAPRTVLRLARLRCVGGVDDGKPCNGGWAGECSGGACETDRCIGGPHDGAPCRPGSNDCDAAPCDRGLFDLTDRLADPGVGAVGSVELARCDASARTPDCVTASAHDPVALDGFIESPSMFALVGEEAIAERDLNGDADVADHVVTLTDHATGDTTPIGVDGANGRAVTRLGQPPFSSPAVAVEDDLAAFLELESTQFARDENGNGSSFDTVLRVFQSRAGTAREITDPHDLVAVDPDPVIDGQSVVASNRRVFFRSRDDARLPEDTTLVSRAPAGTSNGSELRTLDVRGRSARGVPQHCDESHVGRAERHARLRC